ncbi:MAG TPA: M15 family metallopeptidase, partial [Gemmatimonadales bacterium]|nr:M15 family metallopeptidase [Gemmatimonadales bacterium]
LHLAAPLAAQAPADTVIVRDQRTFDSRFTEVRNGDPTIRVEARYFGAHNFTGAPLPGYDADKAFLRNEAAAALTRVQARLKSRHLGLLIYDAYRPVRATEAMVAWAERVGRKVELVDGGYIASRSRHNLGTTVDLTLVDLRTGRPLEMGTEFDTFSEAAHTANATGTAAANRRILVEAMEAEGFQNYDQEWWHFTMRLASEPRFGVPVH